MSSDRITINPQLLTWARERSGLEKSALGVRNRLIGVPVRSLNRFPQVGQPYRCNRILSFKVSNPCFTTLWL